MWFEMWILSNNAFVDLTSRSWLNSEPLCECIDQTLIYRPFICRICGSYLWIAELNCITVTWKFIWLLKKKTSYFICQKRPVGWSMGPHIFIDFCVFCWDSVVLTCFWNPEVLSWAAHISKCTWCLIFHLHGSACRYWKCLSLLWTSVQIRYCTLIINCHVDNLCDNLCCRGQA